MDSTVPSNNVCLICNKKLRLTAIMCKCNNYYCKSHFPEYIHKCTFNYKENYKKQLVDSNPKIIPDKFNIFN